jgi:glycosyltransferase involved in cell wall biosynthesis
MRRYSIFSKTMSQLLVNLSFLPKQPTGLGVYALNIIPFLSSSVTMSNTTFQGHFQHPIPTGLSSDEGWLGHAKRLSWTQWGVPKVYRHNNSKLLFSPIPEAPLFSNCRSVVTVHDLIPLHFPRPFSPLTPYFRQYFPQVINQSQHIICNSFSTMKDVIDFTGIPTQKSTVIPLAYDSENFYLQDLPVKNHFLHIGRHDPHKNLHRLIRAFSLCSNRETQLWLAGKFDPRYTPKLQQLAQSLGLNHRIRFLSYVSYADLPKLLGQAIALVFPSLWEGFGLPVLEAMACGTPVITSNVSSLPEVAGDAALLVSPYCTGEIASAMTAVATQSSLRARLRNSGLKQAQKFSWLQTGRQTSKLLESLL